MKRKLLLLIVCRWWAKYLPMPYTNDGVLLSVKFQQG